MRQFRKTGVDQPVFPVFPLGPGIGKINVQGKGRFARQQIFEQIGRLDAHQPEIRQAGAKSFAVDFPQTSEQPLHGQQIPAGMQSRVLHGKRTVAAAQFDLQRLRAWKQFRRLQRFED